MDTNDASVSSFLDELATGNPAPGGGSAIALAVAMGAALVSMSCRLTLGRDRYQEHQESMMATLEAAEELRRRALILASEDTAAYSAVVQARALPRGTAEQQLIRTFHIQETLKVATNVPLRTCALASQVVELSARILDQVNPNAVADLNVGTLLARAALDGAALNVETNLALIDDEDFKSAASAELRRYLDLARPLTSEH
jgi:formiminotetrahydrofolate cyclodeaminase